MMIYLYSIGAHLRAPLKSPLRHGHMLWVGGLLIWPPIMRFNFSADLKYQIFYPLKSLVLFMLFFKLYFHSIVFPDGNFHCIYFAIFDNLHFENGKNLRKFVWKFENLITIRKDLLIPLPTLHCFFLYFETWSIPACIVSKPRSPKRIYQTLAE